MVALADTGAIHVYAGLDPANLEKAVRLILRELQALCDKPPGRADQYPGSVLSLDLSRGPLVVPPGFAAAGGQASALDGAVRLYAANGASFFNRQTAPSAVTADEVSASLPLGISINNGNGRPWLANAPGGADADGTITVLDPDGAPLANPPNPRYGGVFKGALSNHPKGATHALGRGAVGTAIGIFHGFIFARLGVPSFVITLAGLIGWQGLLLYLLGRSGTINLPFTGFVAKLSDTWLPPWLSWALLVGGVGTWAVATVVVRRLRVGAGLPVAGPWRTALPLIAVGLVVATSLVMLSADRGVPLLLVIFATLVIVLDLALRYTVVGQHVFAVGGNAEAARRAGIGVTRTRVLAFAACSTLAAVGGILAASRLSAVNQNSGGSDILLMAIAAAVIGGTSLFGGRGSTYAALLGILVIQSITNGMLLLNVDSSVRFMVTGSVLAVAVAIDSLARKSRTVRAV